MSYLIDTDVVIYHLNGVAEATELLRRLFRERPAMSAITHMEILEGVPLSPDPIEAGRRYQAFASRIPLFVVDQSVAERCAQIRRSLRDQGRSLRPRALDLLIAATAIEYGLTLVTNNPRDYRDVPAISLLPAGIAA